LFGGNSTNAQVHYFFWERGGYHAVGWEMITKPKELGGISLRRLDIMNQAFERGCCC